MFRPLEDQRQKSLQLGHEGRRLSLYCQALEHHQNQRLLKKNQQEAPEEHLHRQRTNQQAVIKVHQRHQSRKLPVADEDLQNQ